MKRFLALGVSVLAVLFLSSAPAGASTLTDCLARQHVCVASDGRSLVSENQEAQLEKQIGGDAIYLWSRRPDQRATTPRWTRSSAR